MSSPYARRGVLVMTCRTHYGADGDALVLVARGTTRDFNSTIPQDEIDRAMADNPARNRAEYLAEFRSDIESFVALEVIEGCVGEYREMLPAREHRYSAFTDPSGGSADS